MLKSSSYSERINLRKYYDAKKVALFCALAFATNAMADVEVKDTNNFNDVAAKVNQLKEAGKNPLIVVDIDNTLLTSTSDIGGDIWYQWQRGKLDVKPKDGDKVDCLFKTPSACCTS